MVQIGTEPEGPPEPVVTLVQMHSVHDSPCYSEEQVYDSSMWAFLA